MSSPEDREKHKRRLRNKERDKYKNKRSEAPTEEYERVKLDPRDLKEFYDED